METYFANMTAKEGSAERLARDFKVLVHDTEEVLKSGCQTVGERTALAAREADKVIRQNPYPTIGIAFGVGLLVGIVLTRD